MKLEAVTVCINYADFLAETLPHNRTLFDKLVVVTAPEDRATRAVCEHWNVECVLTDAAKTRWDKFCKGAAINEGLSVLSKTDWLVHIDADIMLPPLTRQLVHDAALDKHVIYGIDRYMCPDVHAWRKFLHQPTTQLEGGVFVHPNHFPIGARIITRQFGGYVPIGFFQLWHSSTKRLTYPEQHEDAARGDVAFAAQWPRHERALIPEIIGYHLESEQSAEMGANWGGRKTKPFYCPEEKHDTNTN